MVEVKTSETKEFELVGGEVQFPRDIRPPDSKGIVMWLNEGHGVMVK